MAYAELEIDLQSVPDHVTVGMPGQTGAGKLTSESWHVIGPKKKISRPTGQAPTPASVEFELEIKTGFFAGLDIGSQSSVTKSELETNPDLQSAATTTIDHKLTARITSTVREIVKGETFIKDTGEEISFGIVD